MATVKVQNLEELTVLDEATVTKIVSEDKKLVINGFLGSTRYAIASACSATRMDGLMMIEDKLIELKSKAKGES
jgi:hypothetical protein